MTRPKKSHPQSTVTETGFMFQERSGVWRTSHKSTYLPKTNDCVHTHWLRLCETKDSECTCWRAILFSLFLRKERTNNISDPDINDLRCDDCHFMRVRNDSCFLILWISLQLQRAQTHKVVKPHAKARPAWSCNTQKPLWTPSLSPVSFPTKLFKHQETPVCGCDYSRFSLKEKGEKMNVFKWLIPAGLGSSATRQKMMWNTFYPSTSASLDEERLRQGYNHICVCGIRKNPT